MVSSSRAHFTDGALTEAPKLLADTHREPLGCCNPSAGTLQAQASLFCCRLPRAAVLAPISLNSQTSPGG